MSIHKILLATLIVVIGLFSNSCTNQTPTFSRNAPVAKVTVKTDKPHLKPWGEYRWSQAAYATRVKLEKVRARDWITLMEIEELFGNNDPETINTIEKKLTQMDTKFQGGQGTIRFFEGHETPGVLLAKAGNNSGGVGAYTAQGSNTLFLNENMKDDRPLHTIIHEVSHMAAYTGDYGYMTPDGGYWTSESGYISLSAEEKTNNADTYAHFILLK